jgi:hypothetical protein
MDLLKYQILETTKTFIFNTILISCLLKLVNLSICSHASNKRSMRKVLTQMLWAEFHFFFKECQTLFQETEICFKKSRTKDPIVKNYFSIQWRFPKWFVSIFSNYYFIRKLTLFKTIDKKNLCTTSHDLLAKFWRPK